MNIFFLDYNPQEAAKAHCDKHVIKMIVESLQLLFSAHWRVAGIKNRKEREEFGNRWREIFPDLPRENPYGTGYQNHGCTKWVLESQSNYKWLCSFTLELLKEYKKRWPGREHSCQKLAQWCSEHPIEIKDLGLTNPYLAMPNFCKRENPVESYRIYYHIKPRRMKVTWKTQPPHWWQSPLLNIPDEEEG
jgi:hypothetical protein